ncbi:Phosphatidylinositol 5-phosphate 4-kinase type-2 gamma [Xenoophorus captivus]|uniref:Phosphatidylinositol 5-phosphate 4-kinase type-2 gamma n=1 Tax=Xenoophorus captivus TaxID=1517983 RepID=A0ABV0RF45_9TELE
MAALGNSGTTTSSPMVVLAPKTKTKKKHFVQQKVKVFRASEPIVSVFIWGVNHSSLVRYIKHPPALNVCWLAFISPGVFNP